MIISTGKIAHTRTLGLPFRNLGMFLSSMKLVGAPLPSLQLAYGKQRKNRSMEAVKVSRRDALLSTAATALVLRSFITTEPAEARTGRLEAKRKIMEKLEKLKEEAKKSLKQKSDKDFARLVPPIPFPYPQEGSIGPLVEAIVP